MTVDHLTPSVNVVALVGESPWSATLTNKTNQKRWYGEFEYKALIPILCEPNSMVEVGWVLASWLRKYCEQTTKGVAMAIHPKLFDFLEDYHEM